FFPYTPLFRSLSSFARRELDLLATGHVQCVGMDLREITLVRFQRKGLAVAREVGTQDFPGAARQRAGRPAGGGDAVQVRIARFLATVVNRLPVAEPTGLAVQRSIQ